MNPLEEKANTLSRCGSFYYRTLVDDSKADAEFVSHTHSYARLMPLGDKIATAIKGGCYYEDYYKIIKFTDRNIDWNGVKQALQYRVRGGIGNITSELEYVSSSKARELGTSAWVLLKEDVPTGLINVASIRMQTLSIAPIEAPIFLQVYIIDPEGTAIHLATSTQSVTLAAGEFGEWSFAEALIGTDIYNQNSQIAFQFTTKANATWQDADYILTHLAVGAGSYVPSVQFYKLATAPALPSFNRPSQLTIRDHFLMGDDEWNWISKEGTPQPIAFPGGERDIELPDTQELIWDLYIDEHIMVTSIKMDDGTMLYANQDFASQFGKLTFLKNPIALFPKMQFMAQSYTGRMPNLYNYLVRADEVYGSVGKMMNYMRGSQSIKSLYHASAQAAGMAVIDKDCTVVAVSPLLEGKLYITTAGRYEANYPHTPLKPGAKLPKDYIIGGNQLYRLIGPYDPMPSNITGINLGSALPVPDLIAPNENIALYNSYGLYTPAYKGDNAALSAYHAYLAGISDIRLTKFSGKNAVQAIKPVAASNKDFQADMWFSVPSDGQTYTLEFDSGRLELVWEEGSPARLTGIFANAYSDEVKSLTLSEPEELPSVSSEFLTSTDQVILQQSFDINEDYVSSVRYTIPSMIGAETEASTNFSASLPVYPGDNYILRLKYNSETKELLLVLYYRIQWAFYSSSVPGSGLVSRSATGRVTQCITLTIKNWNIQSLQRVYTADNTDDDLNNYFASLVGADRSFTALNSLETANGMQHFRYTACPNRCVVACINESYMTSQMKLRLMTYLQRELPIGSVLVTANLPNRVNEFQSLIDGTEFVLEELRAGLNKLVGEGNYELTFDNDTQTLTIGCERKSYEAISDLVSRVVPENLKVAYILDGLPEEYLHAEFFECANFQYVDTGVTVTPSTGVRFKIWQDNSSKYMVLAGNMVSPSDPGIFFPLITYQGRVGLNIRGALYLLPDGGYASTPAAAVAGNAFMVINEELKGEVNWLNNGKLLFKAESFTELRPLPRTLQRGDGTIYVGTQGPIKINNYEGRIYFFDISDGSQVRMQLVPAIDPTGTPCMFDKVTRVPFYNTGWRPFIVGFTLEQALQLSKLPKTGGSLTISLPTGYESDEAVMYALDVATSKGWTLTIQTYEAETATSTFGMRRIWVRKSQNENGSYITQDGTRWQVEWCNDIVSPDNSTPEGHGYELFRSVEAAVVYWELEEYVDPEIEQLLTEEGTEQ